MATTMNISLSDDLRKFVDEQVREHAFDSTSEYIRDLLRKQRDIAKLRGLLLEGFNSGPAEEVDDAWFDQLRARIRDKSSA